MRAPEVVQNLDFFFEVIIFFLYIKKQKGGKKHGE